MTRQLTAIVERDGNGYVALCPEVDVASQGDSVAEARSNLEEAVALFFETASTEEIERRRPRAGHLQQDALLRPGAVEGNVGDRGAGRGHDAGGGTLILH